MSRKPVGLTRDKIIEGYALCNNAAGAARAIGVSPSTFKRYAQEFGLYETNQGLKGNKRETFRSDRIPTETFLKKNTFIKSAGLKYRLLKEGLIDNICSECGLGSLWNGRLLVLHLDHIDGDNRNNELANLRMMCPNCHTQTPTYCRGQGKNKALVA